jgi:hypothetical protein
VEINYFISVPDYINLKIENKYGDVYMEDNTGEFRMTLSNGSFKANSLGKNVSITMLFCDARINSIISGDLDASFSEVTIGSTDDLKLSSISSKYNIKKAGSLRGESKRDKFFIGEIYNLQGNSYFSDYKLDNVTSKMDLTTRYGSLNADMIDKGFESVTINSSFSDISLNFDPASSYNLDIKHSNAFLVLPDKNITTEEKSMNDDKKEFVTTGTFGKNPGKARVRIDASRGNIYLK